MNEQCVELLKEQLRQAQEKELDAQKTMFQNVFANQPMLGFENGLPRSVLLICNILESRGAFSQPVEENSALFRTVLDAILCEFKKMNDQTFSTSIQWISIAFHLHAELLRRFKEEVGVEEAPNSTKGIQSPIDLNQSAKLSSRICFSFAELLFTLFTSSLERTFQKLEEIAVPSLVNYTEEAGGDQSQGLSVTPSNVVNVLEEVFQGMINHKLDNTLKQQYIANVFHFIGTKLTNLLFSNPEYCTFTCGAKIRLSISRLESWIQSKSDMNISNIARKQLLQLKDSTNLLFLDVRPLVGDENAIKSAFPTLTPSQIACLVENRRPDNVTSCCSVVEPSVIQWIRSRVSPTESCMEIDERAFITV